MKISGYFFLLFFSLSFCFASKKISKEKINYIKHKYEHTLFHKQHLFYPARKAESLIVIFTSAVKNKYEMLSWFWRDGENWGKEAYLFLKDEDLCWYLGNDNQSFVEDYSSIINYYIKISNVRRDRVFTIGGSMGGYAAIYYATILGLGGVVAFNPQVNKKSNDLQTRFALQNTGRQWQDLDSVVASYDKVPMISLLFGEFVKDLYAAYSLLDVFKTKRSLVVFRHVALDKHKGLNITKKYILGDLKFLKEQDSLSTFVKKTGK
jgi:hypothetical protein